MLNYRCLRIWISKFPNASSEESEALPKPARSEARHSLCLPSVSLQLRNCAEVALPVPRQWLPVTYLTRPQGVDKESNCWHPSWSLHCTPERDRFVLRVQLSLTECPAHCLSVARHMLVGLVSVDDRKVRWPAPFLRLTCLCRFAFDNGTSNRCLRVASVRGTGSKAQREWSLAPGQGASVCTLLWTLYLFLPSFLPSCWKLVGYCSVLWAARLWEHQFWLFREFSQLQF